MDNPADDLVHERILSRYLHLMEERRKSVDFGIDLVKERDSLAKKIKELSEISSRRENEIQSQSETIKNLQGELIHLRQQHQKISTELIEIGDYTRILEKEISEIRLAHLDLKKHFAEREQSREGLEKAHLDLQKHFAEREQSREGLEKAHLDLQKHFAEREQSREGLEKAHLDLQKHFAEREESREGLEKAHLDLQKYFAEREQSREGLEKAHEDLMRWSLELERIGKQDKEEHLKLVQYIGILEQQGVESSDRIQVLTQERDSLRDSLERIQSKWLYRQYQRLRRILPG